VSKVSVEAMAVLVRFSWPGNVRELENVIYRSAVVAQGDAILEKDLPPEIREAAAAEPGAEAPPAPAAEAAPVPAAAGASLESALDFVFAELGSGEGKLLDLLSRKIALRAMKAADGNAAAAAKHLGITKPALQKLL
jgi:two-component system nitrogen regulation response regulator GlnG